MIGENVEPGDYGTLRAVDMAPTIAALLGISTPSAAQGMIQDEMLRISMMDRADKMLALSDQRLRIGNTYLFNIGKTGVSEAASGDRQIAHSSYDVSNYESAQRLARFSVEQISQEIARARAVRIAHERSERAAPAAIAILLIVLVVLRLRPRDTDWDVVLGLAAAAAYHGIFRQQGNTYSFSELATSGLAVSLGPGAWRMAMVLAGGALVLMLRSWRRGDIASSLFQHCYVFVMGQVAVVTSAAVLGIAWNGPTLTWYIPNLTLVCVQFHVLLQGMLAAGLALPLSLATATTYWLLMRARTYHESRSQARAGEAETSTTTTGGQEEPI